MRNYIKLLLIIFVIGINKPVISQNDLDNFTSIQNSGTLPEDFIKYKPSSLTYKEQRADKSEKNLKGEEKFELISEYYMNDMFSSGEVLYGDEISVYVNRVADELLRNFPELRQEIRFYVTRSYVVNAYSTDEGIIFINIGLIARLENEAQLAYILAHEIVHYVKKHCISIYLHEEEKLAKAKVKNNNYKNLSIVEKLLEINFRSKEIETEADIEGLKTYYAPSQYDIYEAENTFDILLYSSFPMFNTPFDIGLLETPNMIIPDYYLIDQVELIQVNEYDADTMSTHPSVNKRKTNISKIIDSISVVGGKQFIQDENKFYYIRQLARFEVIRQLMIDHEYPEALYITGELLHKYPDNKYLKKSFAAALYGLWAYKKEGDFGNTFGYLKDISGEIKEIYFLAFKLSSKDLTILTLSYAWRQYLEQPDDKYLKKISLHLLNYLILENNIKKDYFYNKSIDDLRISIREQYIQDSIENLQVRRKHTRTDKIDTTFSKFALVELLNDSTFIDEFNRVFRKKDSIDKSSTAFIYQGKVIYPYQNKKEKKNKKDYEPIKKIVCIDPYTISVDNRKHENVLYRDSKLNLTLVRETIKTTGQKAGIEVIMLENTNITITDTQTYSNIMNINAFLTERLNQKQQNVLYPLLTEDIEAFMQENGTDYLAFNAVIQITDKKPVQKLVFMSIIPYLWPYTIYKFITPAKYTFYYNILYNIKTGKTIISQSSLINKNVKQDQLNSHIYEFMHEIKKYHE